MNRTLLKKHVEKWIKRLGSQDAVAERCGYSGTSLSLWLNGKYGADTVKMDSALAQALNYRENGWVVVPTTQNYKKVEFVYRSCKEQSMWMPISNKAGSGKTEALKDLFSEDESGTVFYIQAEQWSSRNFLLKLAEQTCGVPKRGYASISILIDLISAFFNNMVLECPILLIDEADKLIKTGALMQLIPIYNRTEHRLGCILSGTDNLEKAMQSGVRRMAPGFDELDSRLGRMYIDLPGAPVSDVLAICKANGLDNDTAQLVWEEVDKVKKPAKVRNSKGEVKEKMIFFCEDLRRLMRLIKREQLSNMVFD